MATQQAPQAGKGKKAEQFVLLQPGLGKKTEGAIKRKVVTQKKGYYNHRRVAKGETIDIWYLGDFSKQTWVVPADSHEAVAVLRDVELEKADRSLTRTPRSEPVYVRGFGQAPPPDADEDEGGAGGGKPSGPVGDDDADEETPI